MDVGYPPALGDLREPREVFAAEYPRRTSAYPLVLRHGGQVTIGERIEGEPALRLEHGKTYDHTTVGATGPRGLDMIHSLVRLDAGVCEVRYADTVRTLAIAGHAAHVWCTCGRGECVHRLAALICAAADPAAPDFTGIEGVHGQLVRCLEEYFAHRDMVAFLLRAADAGYVVLRHAASIDLDSSLAREWFIAHRPPRIPRRDLRSSLFGGRR